MSTAIATKKLQLIEWITQMEDETMIGYLIGLLEAREAGDWWEIIPQADKESILRGIEDVKNGHVIPAAEVFTRLNRK